jgi:hypothetical protein
MCTCVCVYGRETYGDVCSGEEDECQYCDCFHSCTIRTRRLANAYRDATVLLGDGIKCLTETHPLKISHSFFVPTRSRWKRNSPHTYQTDLVLKSLSVCLRPPSQRLEHFELILKEVSRLAESWGGT